MDLFWMVNGASAERSWRLTIRFLGGLGVNVVSSKLQGTLNGGGRVGQALKNSEKCTMKEVVLTVCQMNNT